MSGMKERYRKEITPKLMELGKYKNVMKVPRLEKVVVSIGLGEAVQNAKSRLSEKHRKALEAVFLGLNAQEAAKYSGCSVSAYKGRLYKAAENLRSILGDFLKDP